MKKTHIILLLLIIGGMVGMSFFIKDLTTQETFASAKKEGKFVVAETEVDAQRMFADQYPISNAQLKQDEDVLDT